MKIPQFKVGLLLTLTVVLAMGLSSCERINHNTDSKEEIAADIALVTTEVSSILEFADEASDQTTGKGVPFLFNLQNFNKDTRVIVLDSTYYDGDAVEFLIDFGPTAQPFKPSQKCLDGRFRGGKIKVVLESHYVENTAKSHIVVDDPNGYVFGTENKALIINQMNIDAERELREMLKFNIKSLEIDSKSLEFDGKVSIEKISGINTPGIFGDQYLFNGDGHVELGDEDLHWSTGAPLKKKVEPGCGMIPVKGLLNLTLENSNRNIVVDFDPFENESCDRIIRITNAGTATDIILD